MNRGEKAKLRSIMTDLRIAILNAENNMKKEDIQFTHEFYTHAGRKMMAEFTLKKLQKVYDEA